MEISLFFNPHSQYGGPNRLGRRRELTKLIEIQQVCKKNGHQITAFYNSSPHERKKRCDKCGSETIIKCPSCDALIPGAVRDYSTPEPKLASPIPDVPDYCAECGEPFPWAKPNPIFGSNDVSIDALAALELLAKRFDAVVKQMRQRHDERATLDVKDEYDVQNLMHSLLQIYFDDIRPEESTPSLAGYTARMDFLLKKEKIVIETKMTRGTLGRKKLREELIIDIAHYQKSQDCKTLFCFVYDPECRIDNPIGFQDDLSKKDGDFTVIVRIVR